MTNFRYADTLSKMPPNITNMDDQQTIALKGAFTYIIGNCRFAFKKLGELNTKLAALDNEVGAMHRMVQDYLIVRVAGLFDKDSRVVSFEKLCPSDAEYVGIKNEAIVKKIQYLRNNFAAHANLNEMLNGNFSDTSEILQSNLIDVLDRLEQIVKRS